ncbi:hypothetical protein [Cysteiniphilum litorale]|uniref:hypothetical protein n=1 Tax=Cysteiniphilum litorale TaxID=2056700 RepID=UPI003F882ECA
MKNTNTKKITLLTTLVASTMLSGCASTNFDEVERGYITSLMGAKLLPTKADKVKLFYKDQPNQTLPCKKYDTIGSVIVNTYDSFIGLDRSKDSIDNYLKEGGASLGADAVINISEVDQQQTGYAIKCK